ncbi:hypothetical protein [Methanofollis formosanus]|uniref:hypothetical protein n=1 Tax=Methanofollis formosanus TaxID=299308 RepID=UPI001C7CBF64|nr:hypothetical protein [Methanofollis formosanus]
MNAGVLNEKGRIFSPHPPLSSERWRTEEFWDDLTEKYQINIRALEKPKSKL